MRAYQLPKGGAGIEALVQVQRPDPKPGHRQVLVKVQACSLNFRDLGIVRGTYRMPVRENLIPLSDGAGEVVEMGPGVTRVKVGDLVKRGGKIGVAGSTGLAEGVHVHFAMQIDGVQINPREWWDEHWIRDRIMSKLAPGR